ncbi:phosphoserine phosphatase SerB [Alteromonas sp. H39]|uniref:phosphoserine phosphatase SerB n=1 Tax=Alteromonas sp. H39 TaxID=3389876 RepID=UPI0039E0BA91
MTDISIPESAKHEAPAFARLFQTHNAITFDLKTRTWSQSEPATFDQAILTWFGQALTLAHCEAVVSELEHFVCVGAISLHPLSGQFGETVVRAPVLFKQESGLAEALSSLSAKYHIEVGVQRAQPSLSTPGLLVMDMDSTVIDIECIDEIAKLAGLGDEVAAVTAKAMRGELAFSESLISRVACLEGVAVAQLQQIRDSIPLMPGIQLLVATLKSHGWTLGLASGGFTYFADYLKGRLGLDEARANILEVDAQNQTLTGKVTGDIVDAEVKAQTVKSLAQQYQIATGQSVAMGDGANDLVMMGEAALGIACHAKPVVNEQADVAIRFSGLHTMLYYLGK